MAIPAMKAAVSFARSVLSCKASGIWEAIRIHIEGRNAVSLEQERRATLLAVPQALPPGAEVYDLRSDGSILQVRIPAAVRIDAILSGYAKEDLAGTALPSTDPLSQICGGEETHAPQKMKNKEAR